MSRADLLQPKTLALAAFATLLTLLLLAGAAAAEPSGHYQIPGKEVAIYNLAGKVSVVAGTGSEVEVQLTAAGPDAAKLSVQTGEIDGRETLRVIYPAKKLVYKELGRWSSTELNVREDGTFNHDDSWDDRKVKIQGRGDGLEAHADLVVSVPAGKRVHLHQAVGTMDAEGVTADLRFNSSSAPVTAKRIRGSLRIDVGSGSVQASDVEGNVTIETGSGDVEVSKLSGEMVKLDTGSGLLTGTGITTPLLSASTGSGEIILTGVSSEEVALDTGSGEISVDLASDVDDLMIDTGSGDVRVGLPSSAGADVRIETGSGDVDVNVPHDNEYDRGSVYRCVIGDGDGDIHIDTGSGSVTIEKS